MTIGSEYVSSQRRSNPVVSNRRLVDLISQDAQQHGRRCEVDFGESGGFVDFHTPAELNHCPDLPVYLCSRFPAWTCSWLLAYHGWKIGHSLTIREEPATLHAQPSFL